jgi:hypothetical protein
MFLQVLAGLGTVAVVSAGCFVWLRRFQPFVAFLAITALLYQAWLVRRQPAHQRTRMMLAILWTSVATTVVMGAAMLIVSRRYR